MGYFLHKLFYCIASENSFRCYNKCSNITFYLAQLAGEKTVAWSDFQNDRK